MAVLSMLAILSINAQDLTKLHAFTGAACDHVHYHQGYLYLGAGHTFIVKHQAGEEHPYPETFRIRFTSTITDMVERGGHLYLAVNHDGIYKFDLSNPAEPAQMAHYELDDIGEAVYDIAFKGDSLFVACRISVKVLLDEGASFSHLADFAEQSGNSIARGGEIWNGYYMLAQGYGGATDGIYVYSANDFQQLSYYEQTFGEPEDLVLGQSGVMHVLGGARSWTNPLDSRGLFYTLGFADPTAPELLFADTLDGFPLGLGIASPADAVVRNDTVFVATTSARDPNWQLGQPATGQVYVYDATDTANIHLAETLYGGLWHFGVDLKDDTMFVASEWYGAMSVDISDLSNEREIGRTLTGGWNTSAASHDGKLALPYGGYGFEVYDISNPLDPDLIGFNNDSNFVRSLEWSEDGNYLFGFYVTQDKFRVFDVNTLEQVASLPDDVGWRRTWHWQDRIAVKREGALGATKLSIVNVADPLIPTVDTSFIYNFNDMAVNQEGMLFVSQNDSLSVFNLSGGLQFVSAVQDDNWWNDFQAISVLGDTVFCWVSGQGLIRYLFNGSELVHDGVFTLDHGAPEYMAVDENGLYISVLQEGLFAHDLNTLDEVGYYRHGLENLSTAHWGVWDLVAENGLIYLCEWHGNTTILSNQDGLAVESESPKRFDLFPNPSDGSFRVQNALQDEELRLYDLNGKLVFTKTLMAGYNVIQTGLVAGMYVVSWRDFQAKLLITR